MTKTNASANRLSELLEKQETSPLELALKLEVSVDTIRRLEKPEELIPSKYIAPITAFFGVTADHLLGLDRARPDQLALDEPISAGTGEAAR